MVILDRPAAWPWNEGSSGEPVARRAIWVSRVLAAVAARVTLRPPIRPYLGRDPFVTGVLTVRDSMIGHETAQAGEGI